MSAASDFHNKAMDLAELALLERVKGNMESAFALFERALANELAAIDALEEPIEPTFSVLHRSAGTLALDCKKYRKAEQLAATALAGESHPAIAQELRDVMEQAQANLRGIRDLKGVVARKDDVVNAAESAVPVIAKRLQGLLGEDDIRDLAQVSGQPASHIVPFVHANWGLHVAVNEDTLRYVVFNELIKSGISITQLALEYPHPEIDKARIDTVVVDENYVPEIAVEFKYHHRLPSRRNRDRTAAAGQLLADFSRLGRFPDVQRLVVYLTDDEMLKYFSSQSNGLTMLIDPNQRHKIASDTIPTTTTLRKYAGDWSNGVWLQMIGNWEVGIGHEMIVWQVEPLYL